MSTSTKIEWTQSYDGTAGATWNPVTGCTKVSAGCDHCYAETFAERWRGLPGHHFENGFDVTLRPERVDQPLRWKRPKRIFVNSMSDLFHESVPDDFIAEVFAVMARARWHTFQLLSKRHGRMRSLLSRPSFRDNLAHWASWPLPNVWLGVSAEDQQWWDIRVPALLETPAAVRVDEGLPADIADLGEDSGHRVLRVVRKGARKAKIPLTPATVAVVEAYLTNGAGRAGVADWRQLAGSLLATATGSRLRQGHLWELVRRLARTAGIGAWEQLSPHCLRHSAIPSPWMRAPPCATCRIPSHKDPRTTRRYAFPQ